MNASYVLLPAVVGVEVHLSYLADQRIARIRASALVVERLLGHLVETREEVLLVRDVVADGRLDADALLEVADRLEEVRELLVGVLPPDAERVRDLEVAGVRGRVSRGCDA